MCCGLCEMVAVTDSSRRETIPRRMESFTIVVAVTDPSRREIITPARDGRGKRPPMGGSVLV